MKKTILSASLLTIFFAGFAQADNSLRTQTGQEIGVSISHQKEKIGYEDDTGTDHETIKGEKLGIDYSTAMSFENDWYFKLAGRFAYGKSDISSDLSTISFSDKNSDWYSDVRALFGKDHIVGSSVFSPYTGLGYQHKSIKADADYSGYLFDLKRSSNLYYLPLGAVHRFAINEQSQLETTFEYDYVFSGKQKNTVEYSGVAVDDSYDKDSGFGIRFSSMYKFNDIGIGPFVEYWKLDKSKKSEYDYQELQDKSLEFGIKASMRF